MTNLYRRGRIAEGKVASRLKASGYHVRMSSGSRGPADLYARKGDTKLYIQVKTGSATLSNDERIALRKLARSREGNALYMRYNKGKIRSRFV